MPDPVVSPADTPPRTWGDRLEAAFQEYLEWRDALPATILMYRILKAAGTRDLIVERAALLAVGERDKAALGEEIATLTDAVLKCQRAGERGRRQIAQLTERLIDAQQLLARLEFLRYGSRTRLDERPDEVFECPVCGWPQGGHRGPGRIKGNAENTHEEGCSLYAALHGEPAPRLLTCNDRPARAVLADEEDAE